LLEKPIKELPLSENFYLRSKLMGFDNIQAIIKTPAEILLSKEEFNYDWLGELSRFMTSQKLLHLLQPTPGNNFC
jgi:hypothetical protein